MSDVGSLPLLAGVLVVVSAYGALFLGAELLRRRAGAAPETTRVLVHVVGALIAIPIPLLVGRPAGVLMAVVFGLALAASRRAGALPSVHGVARRTVGEVLFPWGIGLAAVVAGTYGQYVLGVLVLGLADAAAGLVGARYGRRVPSWPTTATAEGSAAFLVVTLVIAGGFALRLQAGPAALVVLGALAVTLVEALLSGGWDDLVVPSAAVVAFAWMF